jgi:hypothetical protein
MRHFSWLISLFLFVLCAGAVTAQEGPKGPAAPPARGTPVFQYALAFVATAGILVVVCYPARRS